MRDNFVAMKASLLVVASFGLVAYAAVQWKSSKRLPKTVGYPMANDTVMVGNPVDGRKLSTQTVSANGASVSEKAHSAARLEKVIQANRSHVTLNRSIVVFENGTSVIVNEPSLDIVQEAKQILASCQADRIRFKTHQVESGRTIVAFEQGAIFHWLFPDDIGVVGRKPVSEMKELLSASELSTIQSNWNPPLHARLGLTARKWLSFDVANLQVVKILKGSSGLPKDTGVGLVQ